MGKFLFPTEIIENSEYAYILEQEYIPSLRNITMDELNASENLRVQFLDLLSYNERMYRETGCSLDIF